MPAALDNFIKQIRDSGVLDSESLQEFLPPRGAPKGVEDLARELVRKKKLTRYQAEEIYRGKAKSLVLGNYILMEKIGAGGMGQVFKARHRRMDRIVAVKVLPPAVAKNKKAIARFEREVKAVSKISHPNIVAAHDADQADVTHFLVMEYVDGSDLSALVRKQGRLPVNQAVDFITQAARGLAAAHVEGIVHRDIKPANLLADKKGTIKILDLGLARMEGDTAAQAELTAAGIALGTVDYMAPEQALNTRSADARADIYGLGCTLFYLLTGRPPFEEETIAARIWAHQSQPMPALRSIRPEIPEAIEAIFQKMVAKNVAERYQTMTEVITALERSGTHYEPSTSMLAMTSLGDAHAAGGFDDFSINVVEDHPQGAGRSKHSESGSAASRKTLLVGGGLVAALVLVAAMAFWQMPHEGTLIVTQLPDSEYALQILDEKGGPLPKQPTRMEKSSDQEARFALPPGEYEVRVTKRGYIPFKRKLEIKSGAMEIVAARMPPEAVKPVKPVVVKPKPAPPIETAEEAREKAFKAWVSRIATLPAEEQVAEVFVKMRELNPDYVEEPTFKLDAAATFVAQLRFFSDNVTNLLPLQALTHLELLHCPGYSRGKGKLSDLKPLQELKLQSLLIKNTDVADLTPIAKLPLTHLDCSVTPVSDLSPLRGMPLSQLRVMTTQVADLSALADAPLTDLDIEYTYVTSLAPLRGKRTLLKLNFRRTAITDLTPLQETSIVDLQYEVNLERDEKILRSLETLVKINNQPIAEFWKIVDEKKKAAGNPSP